MQANLFPAEPRRLPQASLWFGFAAAPFAWALQGLVGVILSAEACPAGVAGWEILRQPGVRVGLAAITLCLLAVAVSAGVTSFHNWRRLSGQREFAHAEGTAREAFVALGGILISTVFSLGIVWASIPILMLQICERAR
jgi:hypothetical protein